MSVEYFKLYNSNVSQLMPDSHELQLLAFNKFVEANVSELNKLTSSFTRKQLLAKQFNMNKNQNSQRNRLFGCI